MSSNHRHGKDYNETTTPYGKLMCATEIENYANELFIEKIAQHPGKIFEPHQIGKLQEQCLKQAEAEFEELNLSKLNREEHKMTRAELIAMMVDFGELISKGDDLYEDMGGHILHESGLDYYIEQFIKNLTPEGKKELGLVE